jgi:copper homeostasis protein
MTHDISTAKTLGAAGVVLGVLTETATIDLVRMAELVKLARPMSVTFHKAIDQLTEAETKSALGTLIDLGVDRVLTSGGHPSALEGVVRLKQMVQHAGGRIEIMAGGQLRLDHITALIEHTGVREVHLGSAVIRRVEQPHPIPPTDGSDRGWNRADARLVGEIVAMIETWEPVDSGD